MRVFLTGATGFIGEHVLRALVERGHEVTCLARGQGVLRIDQRAWPGVRVVDGEFTKPERWLKEVGGHDAIVNAVGIIREIRGTGASFEAVHRDAPIALFEAGAAAGVRKIVQISALGADEAAETRYHTTKRAADLRLAALGVPYVVLRPSLVYGPGDNSMIFFSSLASLTITPVPGDGKLLVQPIYVDDLVRAVVLALERPEIANATVDVGGARAIPFEGLLDILAHWLGKVRVRKIHVPWPFMTAIAALTDALGRGPITRDELAMLRRGSHCDLAPFVERFGFTPVAFEVGTARRPRTEAALWHSRLKQLALPLRLSIAFLWIWTGIISAFVSPANETFALLARAGIGPPLATPVLYATCLVEVVLGAATAAGFRVRLVGGVQIVLILGFTAILTAITPELWIHPFGPLTKNVPLIAATLVMMALARGRSVGAG